MPCLVRVTRSRLGRGQGSGAHAGRDGKPAFRSEQGRARGISDPLSKRSSPSIHLRGWTAWKEAGGVPGALRLRPKGRL